MPTRRNRREQPVPHVYAWWWRRMRWRCIACGGSPCALAAADREDEDRHIWWD